MEGDQEIHGGGTQAQAEAIRDPDAALTDTALFDTDERAVIALTIAMTRDVKVDDAVFAAARAAVADEQQVVELVGVIAAYNMVSRFLVALAIVGLWHNRRNMAAWLLGGTAIAGITALGLIVLNIGSLYRFRYPFLMLIVMLAASGAVHLW
jgi:hypothetical protein